MKSKLNYALIYALVLITNFGLTSCKTEGYVKLVEPLVTLVSPTVVDNPYVGDKGEFIDFHFSATIERKFERFRIIELIDGVETVLVHLNKSNKPSLVGTIDFNHTFAYQLKESNTVVTLVWIIEDEEHREGQRSWGFIIN